MKKLVLTIAAAAAVPLISHTIAASQPGSAATSTTAAADASFPKSGPIRNALRGLLKHAIAFRDETPLSERQHSQVRTILQTHRTEIQTQLNEMRDARGALRKAEAATAPEDASINTAANRVGECARNGALLRAKLGREIRPVLTAE